VSVGEAGAFDDCPGFAQTGQGLGEESENRGFAAQGPGAGSSVENLESGVFEFFDRPFFGGEIANFAGLAT